MFIYMSFVKFTIAFYFHNFCNLFFSKYFLFIINFILDPIIKTFQSNLYKNNYYEYSHRRFIVLFYRT
jgi:hypothetical protein